MEACQPSSLLLIMQWVTLTRGVADGAKNLMGQNAIYNVLQ